MVQKNPTKKKSADVINLLKADHKKVKDLFKEFEGMQDKQNSAEKKKEIVRQICQELTLHALAEEAKVMMKPTWKPLNIRLKI